MKSRRKTFVFGAGALVGAVALTVAGCSSSTSGPGVAEPSNGSGTSSADPDNPTGQQTLPPVDFAKPAAYGNGVTVKVVTISRAQITARGPGEIAGPGIRVQVQITNGTSGAIDLDSSVVALTYGKAKAPGIPSLTSDKPFVGSLAAGKTATATYNFAVPTGGNPINLKVSYTADQPVALFVGEV